jgi:hypothetical protein
MCMFSNKVVIYNALLLSGKGDDQMKLIKNKYVSFGMMFLILAIILSVASNVNDLFVGMLYGISLGILILGLLSTQNSLRLCNR